MEKQKKELTVDATLSHLDEVVGFVEASLGMTSCPMKITMQVVLCIEELYVNVASYAYEETNGSCTIYLETQHTDTDGMVVIEIIDSGKPFNPLEKEDPDITLSADERKIGGLGIFMVKKSMDKVIYNYKDEKNMLRLEKSWHV
ncbi:MAG: ATP-binding protein [Eubacteriales bacterium]|nr:ATP-binding protein [Eubacteriales bacterium]